jgi:hypothetical protein
MKTPVRITDLIQRNLLFRLYKYHILGNVLIVKRDGFRALIRQRGWKIVGVIVGYYLVRDTLVYIVIPYCLARGLQ